MKVFLFRLPLTLMLAITAVLILLKLYNVIVWSWSGVFLPLQLFLIFGILLALLYVLMDIIQFERDKDGHLKKKRHRQKNK